MPDWIAVLILGVIEGVTEFLPVSSTGHLLIAREWVHPDIANREVFNIVIQSGAVVAVLLVFWKRVVELARNYAVDPQARDFIAKLVLAFVITCVGGVGMKLLGHKLPATATPVAIATLVAGILILVIERGLRAKSEMTHPTWTIAVAVGLAQLLAAFFPGTSRSAATILAGLTLGFSRPAATEFSFLLGIPTIFAASCLEIASALREPATGGPPVDWGLILLGTIVSGIAAFAVVKWLLQFVQSHTFTGFGWYRIVLGIAILSHALLGR